MNGKFIGVIKRKIRMDVFIEIVWFILIIDKIVFNYVSIFG